jgi:deoxyribodipyrimidine photolyase
LISNLRLQTIALVATSQAYKWQLCRRMVSYRLWYPPQVTEYLHAGARQFGFMLRGLRELEPRLEALNIPFFLVQVGLRRRPRV